VCEEQANARKSEVREEEGRGRAGHRGSQERHSEAETDTHPETDTHVFWMGVIFHLGMYVRLLQCFLFKEHVTWMKLLTTHMDVI
jgi:hypothetical protein